MGSGIVNLAYTNLTCRLVVIPSTSRAVPYRRSAATSTNCINSSCRDFQFLVASPLPLARCLTSHGNLRARRSENPGFLRVEGYALSRSKTCSCHRRVAASAGSSPDLPANGEGFSESKETQDKESSNVMDGEAITTEVQLSGDDTEVQKIGDSVYSFKTLQKLIFKIGDGSKQLVTNSVGGVVGIFKKDKNKKQPELLAFEASSYESKDGKTALHQWTATELTMQHNQLVRIAVDLNYLIFAFAFFGWVRVLEAVLAAFSTNPAKLRKLAQATNAMDPLTVAWLAYNLRKPILGILMVNPTDFQKLATLKGKLWEELHAFFERQWKVMATISMVRFLSLIATNIPASQWITSKVKVLWDVMMMIPIF